MALTMHTSNRASPSSSPSKSEIVQNHRRNSSSLHRSTHTNPETHQVELTTNINPSRDSSGKPNTALNIRSTERTTAYENGNAQTCEILNRTHADIRQPDPLKSSSFQAKERSAERHAVVTRTSGTLISRPLKKRVVSLRWAAAIELQSQERKRPPQRRNSGRHGNEIVDGRRNHIGIDIDIEALTYYPPSNSSGKQRRKRRRIGDCDDSESEDPEFVVGSGVKKMRRRKRICQRKGLK